MKREKEARDFEKRKNRALDFASDRGVIASVRSWVWLRTARACVFQVLCVRVYARLRVNASDCCAIVLLYRFAYACVCVCVRV